MMLNLTKSEAATIRQTIKSQIDCEREAIKCYPDYAPTAKIYLKDWVSIRRKLKALKK